MLEWAIFNAITKIKIFLILGDAGVNKYAIITEIVKTTKYFYAENIVLVVDSTVCTVDNLKDQTLHLTLKLNIKHFPDLKDEGEFKCLLKILVFFPFLLK